MVGECNGILSPIQSVSIRIVLHSPNIVELLTLLMSFLGFTGTKLRL